MSSIKSQRETSTLFYQYALWIKSENNESLILNIVSKHNLQIECSRPNLKLLDSSSLIVKASWWTKIQKEKGHVPVCLFPTTPEKISDFGGGDGLSNRIFERFPIFPNFWRLDFDRTGQGL